jgi:hypothetical protein
VFLTSSPYVHSKLWAEMPDEAINEDGTLIHTAVSAILELSCY